jgi:hypothetical protein
VIQFIAAFLMPRGNDAPDSESHYPFADYPPSPAPTQLPTPLPDLPLLRTETPDFLSPLIAFDTSTPSQPLISLPADLGSIYENDLDNDITTGHSPPFREAPLPQDSPPPLPIRARTLDPEYQRIVESTIMADDRSYAGHSRTPNLSWYVDFAYFSCRYLRHGIPPSWLIPHSYLTA